MLRSCFLSSFVEFHSAVSEKKSKMSQPIRDQGGQLVFPISPKNTNLVEDVESCSCQVSLNSIKRFQRSRKCLSQSEARAANLFFPSAWKTQTWKRMLRSCFLSSFVELNSAVSEKKSKMSQPIRGQGSKTQNFDVFFTSWMKNLIKMQKLNNWPKCF